MGLSTSHDCWSGSYSSFNRWREVLCRVAGLGELNHYVGFGGYDEVPTLWGGTEKRPKSGLKRFLSKTEEPLVILLNHSDCDGEIAVEDVKPLADRMAQLLKEKVPEGGFKEYTVEAEMVERTEQFIAGLRAAEAAGEAVEFY